MLRSSPRRSQRSKGFKVKHALQLALLLGVCIWLLYQVKHSQDKKTTFSETSMSVDDVLKLGRKYLRPQKEGTSVVDARHKEDEGDEESKDEVLSRPDEIDDNNAGKVAEADDTREREHDQYKDKGTVKKTKMSGSDENADPGKEIRQHNTNDTEEKGREYKEENTNSVVNGERKEDDNSVSENIQVNGSEKVENIQNVSMVNQNEERNENGKGEGKENVKKEDEQTKETEKEDEKNVEKNQDGREAKNGVDGSQEIETREKEEQKIEDPITTDDHSQGSNSRKGEEAKQEDITGDSSFSAVNHQIQLVPDSNSTENTGSSTEIVDDTRNLSAAEFGTHERNNNSIPKTNVGDGSKNEAKTMDASQSSPMTESHEKLQEKDNFLTVSAKTSNSSVQNGTENAYNIVEKQIETTHDRTSEGDNSSLQNTELKQTPDSASATASEQSDSTSTSAATDAGAATDGEFKDTTTNPQLQDNIIQANKSFGDESYSAFREPSDSSDGEKPNINSTAGVQENIVLSDTNGHVHDEKDEQVASSDTSLELKRDGSSTSDNNSDAWQSETGKSVNNSGTDDGSKVDNHGAGQSGHVKASSDTSSLKGDTSMGNAKNPIVRMADENGNTGQNESINYQQENEELSKANSNADARQND